MRISELAKAVDLPVDTIRFYEKRGLLDDQHFVRKDNNYRDYSQAAVTRLRLIKNGQAAGLTLQEMCQNIRAWESDALTPQQKRIFFEAKIAEIDARIVKLEEMKQYIREKMQMFES